MSFNVNPFVPAMENKKDPFEVNPFSVSSDFGSGPMFDMVPKTNSIQAGSFQSGSIKSVRVSSCHFTEMVEQANMCFRPFVTQVNDSRVLEYLPDFVRQQHMGANFKAESFNPIINDIISLSANSLGNVPIVNGWNIRRYSFTIMAEVERSNGNVQSYMIEGFTDTSEIMARGDEVLCDPNMVLYVNNVVSFGQRVNRHTNKITLAPVENFNVINKDSFGQSANLSKIVTQRPYDVANMSLGGILAGNTSKIIVDTRSSVATESKTSNIVNNNPTTYVAKIINDGINAMDNSNTDSMYNTTTVRNMLNTVSEPILAQNGFLQQLGRVNKDAAVSVTSFTWRELVQVDPALGNPSCQWLNLFPLNNRPIHLPGSGNMCDDITGSGNEQVFASMIANGISDLMARCRAVDVSVMATNDSGFDVATVTAMRCYDDNETKFQAAIFQDLFVANIIQMINHNTRFAYNVTVTSVLWGETFVMVNLGAGTYTFLFPNFANSMYSPMLTNNKVGTEDLSRHLLSIANTINQEQHATISDARHQGMNFSPL